MKTRRFLIGTGLALAVVVLLGVLLARRLLVFTPVDLTLEAETTYQVQQDVATSLAAVGQAIEADDVTIDGFALFAGDAIEIDSRVNRDLSVIGSSVRFGGDVRGNAVFVGDKVTLTGRVEGRTVVVTENLSLAGDAGPFTDGIVACVEEVSNPANIQLLPCSREAAGEVFRRALPQITSVGLISLFQRPALLNLFNVLLPLPTGLIFAGVAGLLVTVFPRFVGNMEAATRSKPRQMLATGVLVSLLTVGLAALWLVMLVYVPPAGLLLSPLFLLVAVGFFLLLLAGWVTLALAFGGWLTRRVSNRMIPPLVMTVMGGVVLAFAALVISWLPLGDWIVGIAVLALGWTGLGAAFATRVGLRSLIFV